jgi:hypothetical protein
MESGETPQASKQYTIGDVGAGARVMQGDHNAWIEQRLSGMADSEEVQRRFASLMERLQADPDLDPDERELAVEKTAAVVDGLGSANEEPGRLKRALLDAKGFLTSSAAWAWQELQDILTSEPVQKTIGSISEGATRGAIASLTGQ